MNCLVPDPAFPAHYIDIEGHRMHYLDQGTGPVVLFAHGIPEWSYTFRDVINRLSGSYRCIVPDHLGFGLSGKDPSADFTPAAHARRLHSFIIALGLKDIHLVVHDFGGPIGLGALTLQPELFRSVTISNTWLWDVAGTKTGKALSMMQGAIGRWLYLSYGFSVKFMAKNGFANAKDYKAAKNVLLYPHHTKEDRYANYVLMLEMLRSGGYYNSVLQKLKQVQLPGRFVWGMEDKFFTEKDFLHRWQAEFPSFPLTTINTGHFPHIEAPEEFANAIRQSTN